MVRACNYTSYISKFLDIAQKQFSISHTHMGMHQLHLNAQGHTHARTHPSHLAAHTPTYMQCMIVNERSELGHPCVMMCNGMIRIRLQSVMNHDW